MWSRNYSVYLPEPCRINLNNISSNNSTNKIILQTERLYVHLSIPSVQSGIPNVWILFPYIRMEFSHVRIGSHPHERYFRTYVYFLRMYIRNFRMYGYFLRMYIRNFCTYGWVLIRTYGISVRTYRMFVPAKTAKFRKNSNIHYFKIKREIQKCPKKQNQNQRSRLT